MSTLPNITSTVRFNESKVMVVLSSLVVSAGDFTFPILHHYTAIAVIIIIGRKSLS